MSLNKSILFSVILLAVVQFLHIVDFMILMPLGPSLMQTFQIGTEEFGLLVSSYSFSAALFGFVGSFYLNRFDRKKVLIFLLAFFLIGTFLCGVAPNFLSLLAARIVSGGFGGLLGSQVFSIVGDIVPASERGFATGIVMGAFSLASVLGVPLGLWLASISTWHLPFLALVGLGAVIWIAIFLLLPAVRQHLLNNSHEASPWESFRNVTTDKTMQSCLLLSFLVTFSGFVVIPYLSPFLVGNRSFPQEKLPLIYFFGGFATLFTGPLVGKLCDRQGASKVLSYLSVFAVFPILAITLLDSWHPQPIALPLILFLAALFMVFVSGRMVPTMTVLNQQVTAQNRGAFFSLNSSVQMAATGSAAYLGGVLAGHKEGTNHLAHFGHAGYLGTLVLVASVILVQKFKDSKESV
jgi:MFS transporter, DHA1 family, inner membrane transport protein